MISKTSKSLEYKEVLDYYNNYVNMLVLGGLTYEKALTNVNAMLAICPYCANIFSLSGLNDLDFGPLDCSKLGLINNNYEITCPTCSEVMKTGSINEPIYMFARRIHTMKNRGLSYYIGYLRSHFSIHGIENAPEGSLSRYTYEDFLAEFLNKAK